MSPLCFRVHSVLGCSRTPVPPPGGVGAHTVTGDWLQVSPCADGFGHTCARAVVVPPPPQGTFAVHSHVHGYACWDSRALSWHSWLFACGSFEGSIWDVDSTGHHTCKHVLSGHKGPVWTIQAMGDVIYSGSSDGSVRCWSRDGGCLYELRVSTKRHVSCVMVAGGILFAGCSDGTVACWNLSTRLQMWTLKGPSDGVRRMALTATRLYLCSSRGLISVFEFE